jgi:hypothetical protein
MCPVANTTYVGGCLYEPFDDLFVVLEALGTIGWSSTQCKADALLRSDAIPPWPWTMSGCIASHTRSDLRCTLSGIEVQDGSGFLQAVNECFEQVPHGLQRIIVEQGAHLLPQQAFAPPLGPRRLEERATELLGLIHEKGHHHQHGKHHREMLIAMAKIVLEVIALVFQRIERFIFDAPARPGALYEPVHRALVDPQVGDPTEVLDLTVERFPALDEIDAEIGIGCIEGHVTDKSKSMVSARCSVLTLIIRDPTRVFRFGHVLEQKGMIAFFDAENIPHVMLA